MWPIRCWQTSSVATDTVGAHLGPRPCRLAQSRSTVTGTARRGSRGWVWHRRPWRHRLCLGGRPTTRGTFFAVMTDSLETVISWRRTMCEQALYYRDHMAEFTSKYAGEFILLQDNDPVARHGWARRVSRRELAGATPTTRCSSSTSIGRGRGRNYVVYESALITFGHSIRSADDRPPYGWTGSRCADGRSSQPRL